MQIFPLRFLFFGSSEANFKTAASLRVHILKCVGPTTSCSHSSWRGQQHEELNGIEESFCRSNSKTGSLYNTTIYNSDVIFSDFSMFKLHQKGKTATYFDSQYGYHTSVIWALTFPTLFLKITLDTHTIFARTCKTMVREVFFQFSGFTMMRSTKIVEKSCTEWFRPIRALNFN